ncbi:MAG: carboxylating nicotinate-nucleotide diphosphorylase [Bacteroidales bacterium]|nr:carboxylating nicotinate-nucleotide diphosphorylase [Bacteroidales bacterium]
MYTYPFGSLIETWIKEDVGEGDHTSLSTIPEDARGSATLLSKEDGILAGCEISDVVFKMVDPDLSKDFYKTDGATLSSGDTILKISGSVRSILKSERLVLNIMQRMSGIATETAAYVKKLEGTGARILDTRKTTPGFRYMEKQAVRIGGGFSHRTGLYDMILIKDNHIDFCGGIRQAIESALDYLEKNQLNLKIEIEVRNLQEIEIVLQSGHIDRILLDNFSPELTRRAVKIISGKVETESSGGITLETIREYAECGVNYISVGALTHHIRSLDLSLKANF